MLEITKFLSQVVKGILCFCTFNNALKSNDLFCTFLPHSIFKANNRFRNWYVKPPIPTWDIMGTGMSTRGYGSTSEKQK